jgi:hypothetical protein
MLMLGVITTALAILFMLTGMALWSGNYLRHPIHVFAGLVALLVVGLAMLME